MLTFGHFSVFFASLAAVSASRCFDVSSGASFSRLLRATTEAWCACTSESVGSKKESGTDSAEPVSTGWRNRDGELQAKTQVARMSNQNSPGPVVSVGAENTCVPCDAPSLWGSCTGGDGCVSTGRPASELGGAPSGAGDASAGTGGGESNAG